MRRGMLRQGRVTTLLLLSGLWSLGLLPLGGCAARYQPMGAAVTTPVLTDKELVAADGVRLPVRTWLPKSEAGSEPGPAPRAVVVALHGMNDYSNAFKDSGAYFAARGIAVYAYDQRGFGAAPEPGIWSSADSMVADLRAMVGAVRTRHPGVPVYVLGESMGGAVAMAALADGAVAGPVAGAVLVAPAVWGFETMNPVHRAALWLSYNTVPGMALSAPRGLKIRPSDNIEMLRALGRDPLVIKGTRVDALHGLVELMDRALTAAPAFNTPALVLYGAHEEVLPKKPIERVLKALPPGRQVVAIYPEGYHMLLRDIQAEVVLKDIVAWIENPVAALPSGIGKASGQLVAEK